MEAGAGGAPEPEHTRCSRVFAEGGHRSISETPRGLHRAVNHSAFGGDQKGVLLREGWLLTLSELEA